MAEADAALNAALAAAQADFPTISRDRTADAGTYRYTYATLDAILGACRPALNAHGLALVQLLEGVDGIPALRTELRHKDGGVLGSSFPLPNVPPNPQQLGSLLTYLRRYAVTALLGVAAEEDDDGREATKAKPARKRAAAKPAKETGEELAELRTKVSELIEWGNVDRRDELPAGFDDWLDFAKAVCRDKFGTPTTADLTATQLGELIGALEAELIPF